MQYNNPTRAINRRAAITTPCLILICCLFALLASAPSCLAQANLHDDAVTIDPDQSASNGVRFLVTSHRTIEASVEITSDFLQNCSSNRPMPVSFVVNRDYKKYEVLRFTQTDPSQQWHWNYHFHFVMGAPSSAATVDYIYSLPYRASTHCQIGQSYFGSFSHQKGKPEEYAVDFTMPEGTPILAARGGKVIAYRDDSNVGGISEKFSEACNYINIKHDDGTYAAYVHLKCQGVAVKLGQVVSAGTIIGYSGQTGHVSNPHLHFMVYRIYPQAALKSLPFRTRTNDAVVPQLMEGQTY